MAQENASKDQEAMSAEERLQLATCFLSDVLKTYKLFKENKDLFSRVHTICDQCYSIRPKWNDKRIDYYNNAHDIVFCNHCYDDLDEETKKYYAPVVYRREPCGGLFVAVSSEKPKEYDDLTLSVADKKTE